MDVFEADIRAEPLNMPAPPRRRRLLGPVVLAAGLALGTLYAVPDPHNPLVRLGVLVGPERDDTPILMIATTIAVQPSDLPSQRPSLSTARSIDDIEAAHFTGTIPMPSVATMHASDDEPPTAAPSTTAAALPQPKAPPTTAAPKRVPATSAAVEDLDELRRRAFNSDR